MGVSALVARYRGLELRAFQRGALEPFGQTELCREPVVAREDAAREANSLAPVVCAEESSDVCCELVSLSCSSVFFFEKLTSIYIYIYTSAGLNLRRIFDRVFWVEPFVSP